MSSGSYWLAKRDDESCVGCKVPKRRSFSMTMMTMITRPVSSLYAKSLTCSEGPECMGLGPFPVLRIARFVQREFFRCILRKLMAPGMTWACSCWKTVTLLLKSVAGAPVCCCCCCIAFVCCSRGRREAGWRGQFSIILERMSSMSSSSAPFLSVACAVAVGSVGVVVAIFSVGLSGCLRLLLARSLSMESVFQSSCAVVSQVMALARSLLSPRAGLAGRPCL